MRIRIEWGGGPAYVWNGSLRVEEGRLKRPLALDIEADTPGDLYLSDNRLLIRHRTPRQYSGLDVTVEAPLDAQVVLELDSTTPEDRDSAPAVRDARVAKVVEFALGELLRGTKSAALDSQGNRVLIHRLPSDALRLVLERDHLIFEPGETFEAKVLFPMLEGPVRLSALTWELYSGRGEHQLVSGRVGELPAADGPIELPVAIPLPKAEGVYTLRFQARSGRRIRYERDVQLVVLSAQSPMEGKTGEGIETASQAPAARKLIEEIDPTARRLFRGPDSSGDVQPVQTPNGWLLATGPGGRPLPWQRGMTPPMSWVAFRLHVTHPGRPHLLVVSYPQDRPQTLGISIVEPNAAGQLMPVGLDSGVYVNEGSDLDPGLAEHELLFWPRTAEPRVLFTNQRDGIPAYIGKIRLYEMEMPAIELLTASAAPQQSRVEQAAQHVVGSGVIRPVAGLVGQLMGTSPPDPAQAGQNAGDVTESPKLVPPTSAAAPKSAPSSVGSATDRLQKDPPTPRSGRLVGPYLHKPLFPENFGASEKFESWNGTDRSLDDWVTFWQGTQRLVSYLKQNSYNSLLLAVFADGSTIYPTQLLEPTPRYDTGVYSRSGQDPFRKDVLELLFRLFDREALVLIPELQFAAPLPELERILAQEEAQEGIRLVGADGRTWAERYGARLGLAPYYNLLDPRVQDAVVHVVQELVDRYAKHSSFGGVAIHISSDGYMQLPSLAWGYDDRTIARFAAETGSEVPGDPHDPSRFAERHAYLTGPGREQWTNWRVQQMVQLHRRISKVLTSVRPSKRLYLSVGTVFRPGDEAYQGLHKGAALQDLLRQRGMGLEQYHQEPGIVWLRPGLTAPLDHLPGGLLDADINNSPELDELFRTHATRGHLFYHPPYLCRLNQFDSSSPWQPALTWLVSQLLPSGVENRQRFSHALATLDAQVLFDGGWLVPLGQEKSVDPWMEAFRALPAVDFETVASGNEISTQPVVVRRFRTPRYTYAYVVNDSPWPVPVLLGLSCSPQTPVEIWGLEPKPKSGSAPDQGTQLRLPLGAYQACTLRWEHPDVSIRSVEVEVPAYVWQTLEAEVQSLWRRLDAVPEPEESTRLSAGLTSPGFEQGRADDPSLPEGWVPSDPAMVRLDDQQPHTGERSLRWDGTGQPATLRSSELPHPTAPLLGLAVWLRADRDNVPVTLAFEGRLSEGSYERSAGVLVGRAWRQYLFRVFDVPSQNLEQLRARFELSAEATVWLDDMELVASPLKAEEQGQLNKTLAAVLKYWEDRRLNDCRRLLNSYWARFLKRSLPDPEDQPVPSQAGENSAAGDGTS